MNADRPVSWAASLGHAMTVLESTPRRDLRLGSVHHFLLPPARLNQILFAFNSHGVATGYVAWAFVTDVVADALSRDPDRLLALPEWNEGCRLWIMDIAVPAGGGRRLLRQFRARLPGHNRVWWRRTDRGGPVRTAYMAKAQRGDA